MWKLPDHLIGEDDSSFIIGQSWRGQGRGAGGVTAQSQESRPGTLILQDQTPPVASSSCCILYFANLPHSWSYFSQNHLGTLNSVCLEPHTCAPWATEIWWLIWLLRFNEIEPGEGFTFDYYDPPDTNFHDPLVKEESGVCSSALRPQAACLHSHWWPSKSFAPFILLTPEQPHEFVGIYLFYSLRNWGIHWLRVVNVMQIWKDKVLIVF